MGDTIVIETPVATVLEVTGLQGPQGPTGPQGPSGEASGSIAWSNVTGKPSTFTPSAHTHTSADVTDFASAVVAAAPPTTNASLLTSGTLADARLSAAVTTSLGKADTASQPGHTHAVSDVTGLQTALDGKQASGSYAAASHTHTPSEVGLGNVSNTAQVTSVTGTAPIVSSGGTTPVISVTTGSTAGTVAAGDHTHTNFSSLRIDPANGSMGSLVVGNTTSGPNNYVTIDNKIRLLSPSNSFVASLDATALSADRAISLPDASGTIALTSNTVSSVASSASDVLGVSGANITGVDAGSADRLVFWDDSANKLTYASVDGMTFDGTTLRAAKTDVYTANDTWNKPAGAKHCLCLLIGGGGGGGSGRRGVTNTTRGGGGGGSGGCVVTQFISADKLGTSETITVGAGGNGAVNVADSTNGGVGSVGGDSSIGTIIVAKGGNGGLGGLLDSAASTAPSATAGNYSFGSGAVSLGNNSIGGSGAHTAIGTGATPSAVMGTPSGGGGGGKVQPVDVAGNGGNGGNIGATNIGLTTAPSGAGITSHMNYCGTGGRGSNAKSTTAGSGGGLYGGGGGGGGGHTDGAGGTTAGGNGGAGIVVITTFF